MATASAGPQFSFMLERLFLGTFLFFAATSVFAQSDSIILKNGNVVVGEIKSMDNAVVTIETVYSKNDFNVKWSGIKKIFAVNQFLITLKSGARINGTFKSADSSYKIIIEDLKGNMIETNLEDIVYLKSLKTDFWSRAYVSIEAGINITKANRLRQYSVRSNFGYIANKWQLDFYYNDNRSRQDSVAETKRTEAGSKFTYYLPKDWYLSTSLSILSNTEQALKLRTSGKLGAGNYFVHTNRVNFGAGSGLALNDETFTNNTPRKTTIDGYIGTEANLFDIGDFSMLTSLFVYKSIDKTGRWRSDFKVDTKYKIVHDFYIKFSTTVNYDNRPAVAGKETDYVYAFTVGWEL